METLVCPDCNKFKNVWGKSLDHHIFLSKDKLHEENREKLKAMNWSLSLRYPNRNKSILGDQV